MAKRRVPKDQKSSNEGAWTSFRRWIDTPLPWLEGLQGLAESDSVFDPAAERVAKNVYRALVPTTPRGVALEVIGGKVGSPVIGAGARRLGRALDVPFDPAKRRTMGTLGGKDTLENMQRRKILTGTARPVSGPYWVRGPDTARKRLLPSSKLGSLHREAIDRYLAGDPSTNPSAVRPRWTPAPLSPQLRRGYSLLRDAAKTQSDKPGIIGDIAEHMNVLARKIGEETAEETGEAIAKGADDESLRKMLDNLLRRIGVERQ
jgi:hypothetical protein